MSRKKHRHTEKQTPKNHNLSLELSDQVGKKGTLDAVIDHYKHWLPHYQEFSQGRSNFQIEKMIATEHATPAASYQHTLYQLRVMHSSLVSDFVQGIESTREFEYKWKDKSTDQPQWWPTPQGGKKLCWYDTDRIEHEHAMEELKMSVKDKLLQLETFTKVLQAMEEKNRGRFTKKQLNDEEPEYWKQRLARQMADSYIDRQTGVGTGNITSLRRAVAKSPLADSLNQVTDFPDFLNAIMSDRESAIKVLNEINNDLFKHMDALGGGEAANIAGNPAVEPTTQTEPIKPPTPNLQKLKQVGIEVSDFED